MLACIYSEKLGIVWCEISEPFTGRLKLFSSYQLDVQQHIFVCNVEQAFCCESFVVFMLLWLMYYKGNLEINVFVDMCEFLVVIRNSLRLMGYCSLDNCSILLKSFVTLFKSVHLI